MQLNGFKNLDFHPDCTTLSNVVGKIEKNSI